MTVEQRALGRSGLTTTPLMLGGNVFGWTCDAAQSFAVLDAFLAGGGRLIDTADMYTDWIPGLAGGESETMIGDWQRSRRCRDRILIATKIGRGKPPFAGLSARAITVGVEESLRRLRTDHIDIYFAHLDDRDTPLDETLGAFDALVRDGKVRALGASHYDAARLAEADAICAANGWARYEIVQPRYNLMARNEYEGALQAHCLARGLGVVPFYGLASGFLSGKYRRAEDLEGRSRGPEVARYLTDRGFRVLDALDAIAADTGMAPAQVAIAWLIAQPGVTAPIASATDVAQVEALLAAMTLRLSADQLDLLDRASADA
jgi:aryl-alcohol dehydrogenase-like predicted oxidoreductase